MTDVKGIVQKLWEFHVIQSMMDSACLDYGLEQDMAFVIVAAQLKGLLKPNAVYTPELIALLHHPEDDVSASLRILDLYKKLDHFTFQDFAERFGVSFEKVLDAYTIARDLAKRCNERFTRGIRPHSNSARTEVISNLFSHGFIFNPCIFIGDSKQGAFLDYEKDFQFDIAPQSRLYASLGFRFNRPAVYYSLKGTQCCEMFMATFVCLVPIYNEQFSVGAGPARRIMSDIRICNGSRTDPAYISLRRFDAERSALHILYTNNSKDRMMEIIRSKIKEEIAELTEVHHRHRWISKHQVNAIIGPGFQVLGIICNLQNSDSICFEPKCGNKFNQQELKELSYLTKKVNKKAIFMVFSECDSERENLVAVFPTVEEAAIAYRMLSEMDKSSFFVRMYNITESTDFLKKPKKSDFKSLDNCPDASCVICDTSPQEDKVLRLTLCGHVYCFTCFANTIKHTERFPVNCAMPDCAGILTFFDFDYVFACGFFTTEEFDEYIKNVVQNSFNFFMRSLQNGFKRCMNTDCTGILDVPSLLRSYNMPVRAENNSLTEEQRKLLTGKAIDCMHCGKARCAMCGFDFHGGLDCQEFYARNFVYNDSELADWKKANPKARRFCPNNECHILIEKSEGCNHMQCVACKIHFCWLCTDFQTSESQGIYAHMNKMHGGNGLANDLVF